MSPKTIYNPDLYYNPAPINNDSDFYTTTYDMQVGFKYQQTKNAGDFRELIRAYYSDPLSLGAWNDAGALLSSFLGDYRRRLKQWVAGISHQRLFEKITIWTLYTIGIINEEYRNNALTPEGSLDYGKNYFHGWMVYSVCDSYLSSVRSLIPKIKNRADSPIDVLYYRDQPTEFLQNIHKAVGNLDRDLQQRVHPKMNYRHFIESLVTEFRNVLSDSARPGNYEQIKQMLRKLYSNYQSLVCNQETDDIKKMRLLYGWCYHTINGLCAAFNACTGGVLRPFSSFYPCDYCGEQCKTSKQSIDPENDCPHDWYYMPIKDTTSLKELEERTLLDCLSFCICCVGEILFAIIISSENLNLHEEDIVFNQSQSSLGKMALEETEAGSKSNDDTCNEGGLSSCCDIELEQMTKTLKEKSSNSIVAEDTKQPSDNIPTGYLEFLSEKDKKDKQMQQRLYSFLSKKIQTPGAKAYYYIAAVFLSQRVIIPSNMKSFMLSTLGTAFSEYQNESYYNNFNHYIHGCIDEKLTGMKAKKLSRAQKEIAAVFNGMEDSSA